MFRSILEYIGTRKRVSWTQRWRLYKIMIYVDDNNIKL